MALTGSSYLRVEHMGDGRATLLSLDVRLTAVCHPKNATKDLFSTYTHPRSLWVLAPGGTRTSAMTPTPELRPGQWPAHHSDTGGDKGRRPGQVPQCVRGTSRPCPRPSRGIVSAVRPLVQAPGPTDQIMEIYHGNESAHMTEGNLVGAGAICTKRHHKKSRVLVFRAGDDFVANLSPPSVARGQRTPERCEGPAIVRPPQSS